MHKANVDLGSSFEMLKGVMSCLLLSNCCEQWVLDQIWGATLVVKGRDVPLSTSFVISIVYRYYVRTSTLNLRYSTWIQFSAFEFTSTNFTENSASSFGPMLFLEAFIPSYSPFGW